MINTNSYLLIDEESKEAVIIDLGGDCQVIMDEIEHNGAKLKYILNTHGHFDHMGAAGELRERLGVDIYAYENSDILLMNPRTNLSELCGPAIRVEGAKPIADGELIGLEAVLLQKYRAVAVGANAAEGVIQTQHRMAAGL